MTSRNYPIQAAKLRVFLFLTFFSDWSLIKQILELFYLEKVCEEQELIAGKIDYEPTLLTTKPSPLLLQQ